MKEQIKDALKKASEDNTWVVHVLNFKEAEELFEGAVERIEQLEQQNAQLIEALEAIRVYDADSFEQDYYDMQEIADRTLISIRGDTQ